MARRITHPSLLPAVPVQEIPRRPLSLGVHVQRIQIDDLVVTDHRLVLAHARTAARQDPETAALLGYGPTTPLTLQASAALLAALHTTDELSDMGMRIARQTTRTTAATQHRGPVTLELSDAPEQEGR
ncbi:hypothetical protein DBP19_36570 [Streptomyces sp. CS090A]|uniref:hypothetical protein n=1 Tax=Streptomyces sp. CS090A TaxID=2162710 RepID=UPI000D50BA11|nr:hypothetical protein [Streptomyces sp. CS090A]PVC80369.1 hypothetical protein DBP19_36570 [Streptomyces sp. CS090A]